MHYSQQLTLQHSAYFQSSDHHMKVSPSHILTNLIISALLDANDDRKWGKSPILRTVNSSRLPKRTVVYQLGLQVDLENPG